MVLHGVTNQSTLREPATLHGLTWWNKPEHSEGTSNLGWSYMVEQTRALWGNQVPCMVLHRGTNQSILRNQQPCMVLHVGTNQSTLREPARGNQQPCMVLHGGTKQSFLQNQQPCVVLHGGTNHSTQRESATWHGLTWWNKLEHPEGTSNLAWWNKTEHSDETSNLAWTTTTLPHSDTRNWTQTTAWGFTPEKSRPYWWFL